VRVGLREHEVSDDTTVAGVDALRNRYLDLLKRALTHTLYWPPDLAWSKGPPVPEFVEAVRDAIRRGEIDVLQTRIEGRDWPAYAQTMIGMYRLDNLQHAVETTIAEGVLGDLIEAGAWRGGATILMRGVLAAYEVHDRTVFVADSFRGLPPPSVERYPADAGDAHHNHTQLAVTRADVERNFSMYGLLDDQVTFLEGWFSETLPTVRDRTWAVIRIDGDMYESTMDALVHLYPGLSVGGYCIIDDFCYERCRQAVDAYRSANGVDEPIEQIDWTGVYWRRSR
jgi:O-methyltransferase